MPCRSCRPIVNAALPPPLVVRATQRPVRVQAHQQPRARVLELIRIEGAGVLDQVVLRLVPGRLINGVGDAAHRLPNQPHVLGAHLPVRDRVRERWQLRRQQLARSTVTGQGRGHPPATAATPPPPRSSSAAAAGTPHPTGSRAAPPTRGIHLGDPRRRAAGSRRTARSNSASPCSDSPSDSAATPPRTADRCRGADPRNTSAVASRTRRSAAIQKC